MCAGATGGMLHQPDSHQHKVSGHVTAGWWSHDAGWWSHDWSLTTPVTSLSGHIRAAAAGPVSPVSTGPLFPHLWLAWRRQLASLLGGPPRKAPKHTGAMLKLARWL